MAGFYSTAGWQALRGQQLRLEPTCRLCRQAGRVTPATVADHVEPHRGDRARFFDSNNLMSLCATCHNAIKQQTEKRGLGPGTLKGSGLDGLPLDGTHPWFAGDAQ